MSAGIEAAGLILDGLKLVAADTARYLTRQTIRAIWGRQ